MVQLSMDIDVFSMDMTTATPSSPASGEIASLRASLRGQYAIERELGRGGMGIVVLARDERLDRQVALKVLPPTLAEQPNTRERFLREARMAAQLSHPNIVPVYRADDIGGFAFFAMGFVDGTTLGDRIRDRGTLPVAEVVRVLREVSWALAYAHARGIVHRDVKPDNILLERATGRAVVTDFGIARADFNPALTQDGLVLGTVHFMSPEQASGETLDGRSDLYALGCIGFLALSGRLPFEGDAPQGVLVAHATKEPPSLTSVAPNVPRALADVIDRCLRKSPDQRFATGEALADALAKALDEVQHNAREDGTSTAISSDEAMAVWRRAAELQAEAAARLESRMRESHETRQLVAVQAGTGATRRTARAAESDGGVDGAESAASGNRETPGSIPPTDSYRLVDVEAAALEVGISQKYVALALAELKASPAALLQTQPAAAWKERLATRMLGTSQRTLSVTRIFRHAPRVVLHALGRSLQQAPYLLSLRDTLGGHPLDGGVLVFDLPTMTDGNYKWTWVRYGVYVPQLRVSMATVAGSAKACEVTMTIDLRRGFGASLASYAALVGLGGGGGGLFGLVVAKKALLLAGAALFGPAGIGAAVVGAAVLAGAGPVYRWEVRKAAKELEDALAAVDGGIRALDIFGEVPSTGPRSLGGGDPFLLGS